MEAGVRNEEVLSCNRMLRFVSCLGAVIRPSDGNVYLETPDGQFLFGAGLYLFLWGHHHTPTRVTSHVELSPSPPLRPLVFCCADVMNDTCDKVPSVCTRHEILSNAFRVLCIGYAWISMDSISLFAKLCTALLTNVSPPAYVSLILVSHVSFKLPAPISTITQPLLHQLHAHAHF